MLNTAVHIHQPPLRYFLWKCYNHFPKNIQTTNICNKVITRVISKILVVLPLSIFMKKHFFSRNLVGERSLASTFSALWVWTFQQHLLFDESSSIWDWKVSESKLDELTTGLKDPILLRACQWPFGQKLKNKCSN